MIKSLNIFHFKYIYFKIHFKFKAEFSALIRSLVPHDHLELILMLEFHSIVVFCLEYFSKLLTSF